MLGNKADLMTEDNKDADLADRHEKSVQQYCDKHDIPYFRTRFDCNN